MFGTKKKNYRHLQEQITALSSQNVGMQLDLDKLRLRLDLKVRVSGVEGLAVLAKKVDRLDSASGGTWKTAAGDILRIRDMSTSHIENCIKGGFAEQVPGALREMTNELKRRTECEVWERRTAEEETWDAAKGVSKAEIARAKAACTAAAMDDDYSDPFPGIGEDETSLEERIVEEAMLALSPYEDVEEPVYQKLCKSVRGLLDRLKKADTAVAEDDPLELRIVQAVQSVFDPYAPLPREACYQRASAKVGKLLDSGDWDSTPPINDMVLVRAVIDKCKLKAYGTHSDGRHGVWGKINALVPEVVLREINSRIDGLSCDSTPDSIGSAREISRDTAVGQVFGKSDGLQHIEYPTFAIDGLQKPIFIGTLYGASLFVEEGTPPTIRRYITKFLRGQW